MMDIQYCAPHAQNAFHFLPASIRLLHTAKGRGAGGDYVNLAFFVLLFSLPFSNAHYHLKDERALTQWLISFAFF
jgi:hypothetical protein